jgi:hypothetical protein
VKKKSYLVMEKKKPKDPQYQPGLSPVIPALGRLRQEDLKLKPA